MIPGLLRFVADENVDGAIVLRLRDDGHDVLPIAGFDPALADDGVLALANETSSILVTSDKDFGDLVFRRKQVASGVLLLRLGRTTPEQRAELVGRAVAAYGAEIAGAFSRLTRKSVRIRRSG